MGLPRTSASLLLVAVVLTGCTTGTADKGGGSGGVVNLVLASPDLPGRPSSRDVQYFTEQVSAASGGRLRIETRWNAADGASSWDQVTARQVIDGQADLGF